MNQGRTARWRVSGVTAALVLALVVVAAACGGSDDDDESAGAATTATIDVEVNDTTTSTLPATTTTLSEADRFRTIAVDLWNARNELYQNPPADPEAALAEIFDPQCDCFQAELDDLIGLAAAGHRLDGPPAMPLGVRFADVDATSGIAGVQMSLGSSSRRVVDASGEIVEELPEGEPIAVTMLLNDFQGRWLIDSVVVLQVDAGFVQQLVTEGLP